MRQMSSGVSHDKLAQVAHELRSPLGAILGWAHLLRRQGCDEDHQRGLEVIEQCVHAQNRLLESLLYLSRLHGADVRLDMQDVEPRLVVDAAMREVESEIARKRLRVGKVLDLAAGPVTGDEAGLVLAVRILLRNAVRFSPDEGTVEVHVTRVGNDAEIAVADRGPGIEPEALPGLFASFDEGAAQRQAPLCLGLALVQRIASMHGGSVHAASEGKGRGATFALRLPLRA